MENDQWKFYTQFDFSDLSIAQYNIDTRDFHCITKNKYTALTDKDIRIEVLKKHGDRFFYTTNEILSVLNKLFIESGANVSWRHLILEGEGASVSSNWELKYLRIIRTEYGLVICNNSYYALKKSILDSKINKEYLNAH